jgi:hypothetical protein
VKNLKPKSIALLSLVFGAVLTVLFYKKFDYFQMAFFWGLLIWVFYLPFTFEISTLPGVAKKSRIWIFINFVILIAYWIFVPWPEHIDEGYIIQGGDSFLWGFESGFIFLLMILVNALWLLVNFLKKSRPAVFVWLLAMIVWACVFLYEDYIFLQAKWL